MRSTVSRRRRPGWKSTCGSRPPRRVSWLVSTSLSEATAMAQAQDSPHQSKLKGLHAIFPRPEVTDRSAFAPGIEISPALDLLILSGISAYPPDVDPWSPGEFQMPQDPAERSKMATENLDRVLKAAGSTWEHIVFNVNYAAPGGG